MKQRNLYVDSRIIHRINFNRTSYSGCIYCGQQADSREHVPSKVFLLKPYPENLSIVPSCSKCNNGYSLDEIFLYLVIEKLKKSYYKKDYKFCKETTQRMLKYKTITEEIDSLLNHRQSYNNLYAFKDERINNVLEKLALGHAVYELSVGYKSHSWSGKCNFMYYNFVPNMNTEEIEEIESCFILDNSLLPEIGSRVYDNIYKIEMSTTEGKVLNLCLLDWIDVQNNRYKYTSYIFNHTIVVKIVISEFLYAVITFEEDF